MREMRTHWISVNEPWFMLIAEGRKTVEGRLNKGKFKNVAVGDNVVFTNDSFGYSRAHNVCVTAVKHYPSFRTYLGKERLQKCLPGVSDFKNGVTVYRQFYSAEAEREYGVLAIRFKQSDRNA
jgi:ASC-1-like (ASCH) protein